MSWLETKMEAEYSELELLDWVAARPFVILANRNVTPRPTMVDVPVAILEQLDGRRPDFLVADPGEIGERGIVLSPDQMELFRAGEPILLAVGADAIPPPLQRGRREHKALEKRIQDALAIQVYLGTERICALLQICREVCRRMTVPKLRETALELLADKAWVDVSTGSRNAEARALRFFRTQYDSGSRLIGSFFPDNPSPREAAKRERLQVERDCIGPAGRRLAAAVGFAWARQSISACLKNSSSSYSRA